MVDGAGHNHVVLSQLEWHLKSAVIQKGCQSHGLRLMDLCSAV
jgi:hypothetical protein